MISEADARAFYSNTSYPDEDTAATAVAGGHQAKTTLLTDGDEPPREASSKAPHREEQAKAFFNETNKPAPRGIPADQLPENIRALRDDPGRTFYSPQITYREAGLEEAFAGVDVPEEAKAVAVAEYREILADHDLGVAEARELVSLARELGPEADDEAQRGRWGDEAWETLVRSCGGEKEAAEALDLAKQLVRRDPRTAGILRATRLGYHPMVISLLVEKARFAKQRGKL